MPLMTAEVVVLEMGRAWLHIMMVPLGTRCCWREPKLVPVLVSRAAR